MKLLENLIPASLANAIGATFMHSLWQIAALAILLILVLILVPKNASQTRYRFGLGTLTLMFCLPILTFFYLYQPGSLVESPGIDSAATTVAMVGGHASLGNGDQALLAQFTEFFNQNGHWILLVWLLGALFFTFRFTGNVLRVRNLRRRETAELPTEIRQMATRLAKRMGIRQAFSLKESAAVNSPMVIGALKPLILLPVGLATGLNPKQIECLLAHELAHIQRYDYLVNIFQCIAEIVLFYHPAIWWVSRLVRNEREMCCDQLVIEEKSDRIAYARALLNLELIRQARPELAMSAKGGKLYQRIRRITGKEVVQQRGWAKGILLGMGSLAVLLLLSASGTEQIKASNRGFELFPLELMATDMLSHPVEASFVEDEQNDAARVVKKQDSEPDEESPGKMVASIKTLILNSTSATENFLVETCNRLTLDLNDAHSMAVDSPLTGILLIEDGDEIWLSLDANGKVISAKRNGNEVSSAEYDHYQRLADKSLRKYVHGNDVLEVFREEEVEGLSTPPRPPRIPPSHNTYRKPPNPPADMEVPPVPEIRLKIKKGKDFNEEEFTRKMEGFEKDMEAWVMKLEVNLKEQDWEKWGEEMEEWAEKLGDEIGQQDWEKFGREMEKWGEEFGREMEKMGKSMEQKIIRIEVDREEERDLSGIDHLKDELVRDGLIDKEGSYRFKIDSDKMTIDGKRQDAETHLKYMELLERDGFPANSKDGISVNVKRKVK